MSVQSVFKSNSVPFVISFIHWFWQRIAPYTRFRLLGHGGCDRSTADAYSCQAPDPTPDIYRRVRVCHTLIFVVFLNVEIYYDFSTLFFHRDPVLAFTIQVYLCWLVIIWSLFPTEASKLTCKKTCYSRTHQFKDLMQSETSRFLWVCLFL